MWLFEPWCWKALSLQLRNEPHTSSKAAGGAWLSPGRGARDRWAGQRPHVGGRWPGPPVPRTELGPAARAGVWRLGPPAGVGCRPRQERSGGSRTPHLGLLRGVGEGQRVDAAGGQARLERFGAVSENDLLALGREGVLSCLKKRRRALRRGPEREPRPLRGAALRRARRVGSRAVRRAGRRRFALHGKLRSPPTLTLGDGSR